MLEIDRTRRGRRSRSRFCGGGCGARLAERESDARVSEAAIALRARTVGQATEGSHSWLSA